MVKLSISNLNSKVGKPVKPANVESLGLRNKQLDEIEVSFAVFKELRQLDLSQNRLRFVRQLENVFAAPRLEELDLSGNPIAKELADFRLFMIAHAPNTLRLLNGEPVSDLERCRAWLAFPDRDPIKHPQLQSTLALPISDAVLDAYAAAGRALLDEGAAAEAAQAEQLLAAERDAVERRRQVLADREKIERDRAADDKRRADDVAERARLLAEAREAERQMAVDAGLIAPAPPTTVQVVAAPAPVPAAPVAVPVAVPTPSIDDIFGSAPAAPVKVAATPTPAAAGSAAGLWWTDAPIGGVLSEVEGVDDAPLDLASVAERARARAAERKQQEAATLAKLQAVQAAKEEAERLAAQTAERALRERQVAAIAEKARQEALAREQAQQEDARRRAERDAAELAARRAHEAQEKARAEQRRRDEEAAQRERDRVAKERADAEREKAARAAQEATERLRREADESRLRDTATAAAATSSGTIFEESPEELRKAVERQERQLEALRNAGAHLVALDKAEEKLEKARRRLAAGGTAAAPEESPSVPVRITKSLDTRLTVATTASKAPSIFDDVLDDPATRKAKAAAAAAAAKSKSHIDDLFGAI